MSVDQVHFLISSCDLGYVLIATTSQGICSIELDDSPLTLEQDYLTRFPQAEKTPLAVEPKIVDQIIQHIENPRLSFHFKLDPHGTNFQQRVWQLIQKIPAGKTETYTGLAQQIGNLKSIRAVATACGANPIAVLIPCHRVLRTDGGLGGYRWGLWRKQTLLQREGNLLF